MSREHIALDIDEVLFPFVEHFVVHDQKHQGSSLCLEDFYSYRFQDVMKLEVHEAVSRVYDFNQADHSHIQPVDQALEAVELLKEHYDLSLITARHPQFAERTHEWLDRHFRGAFDGVEFIGWAAVMERPLTKAEVCESIGSVALVDDSLEHVSQCAERGIEGVLFGDYPWNQTEVLPSGVTRRERWQDVLEHFGVGR